MTTIYITPEGKVEYCYKDQAQKCFDKNKTCSSTTASTACNTLWTNWTWFGNWWAWGDYWGVYGESLRYLYTEIDAPDKYMCGYVRPCFNRVHCDDELTDSVCTYPRIANCKTNRCVSDYSTIHWFPYSECFVINGKDREQRCCAPPEGFECKEGECDFEYEIYKKEYTIEYELVRSAYTCTERPTYENTYCTPPKTYNDKCFKSQPSCSPKEKCLPKGQQSACVEDTPPKGYKLIDTTVTSFLGSWWYYQAIVWDYEVDDCDCTCSRCVKCEDYDCDLSDRSSYWWGPGFWWGCSSCSYFDGIGTDCCGSPGLGAGWYGHGFLPATVVGICPEKIGDGSNKPWYCNTGGDCEQVDTAGEDFNPELYTSGPYLSHYECAKACAGDKIKCISPDRNYSRFLCCDPNYKKYLENDKDNKCGEVGPSYQEKATEVMCKSTGCDAGSIRHYTKEMCTYDNNKSCVASKVERKRFVKTYEYSPPIADQAYAVICSDCDPDTNTECLKQEFAKCPSNTEARTLKIKTIFKPEEIVDTATVKLITVFCKITTKQCQPTSEEQE